MNMNMNVNPEIKLVENQLHLRLKQYRPKPEFVSTLKHRLTTEPAVTVEAIEPESRSYLKILAVLGGATVLILILRALFKKN